VGELATLSNVQLSAVLAENLLPFVTLSQRSGQTVSGHATETAYSHSVGNPRLACNLVRSPNREEIRYLARTKLMQQDSPINALPIADHQMPDIDIESPLAGVKERHCQYYDDAYFKVAEPPKIQQPAPCSKAWALCVHSIRNTGIVRSPIARRSFGIHDVPQFRTI
jgi:hypothetical protein